LGRLGVGTEKLRKVPATRDVRLFAVFVASVLSLPMIALWYLALAPILYLSCSIVLAYKIRSDKVQLKRVRREPIPEILMKKKEITEGIESLVSNTIKLGLALIVVLMITPVVSGITLFDLDGLVLSSDHLLSASNLIVIIYFGYRILQALRIMIDITTKRLVGIVGITESTIKHMLGDCLYMVLAALLWAFLPPQLKLVPYVGELASRLASLTIFVFFLLVLYDLAKLLYRTFGDLYKEIIAKIARRLR
jgi:hypothetical protein